MLTSIVASVPGLFEATYLGGQPLKEVSLPTESDTLGELNSPDKAILTPTRAWSSR